MTEVARKLAIVRRFLQQDQLSGIRFRGSDWFAWATGGGSNVVLLTMDTGVAEILITLHGAWVLTDEIEAARLSEEEVRGGYEVIACPWTARPQAWNQTARELAPGRVASDRPVAGEEPLPPALLDARSSLQPEEVERYRALGREAAEAMTDVMLAALPEWSGWQLAGAGAEALWSRGIEPALTLVGDERRLPVHRHPTASAEKLGSRAMLVFCARRQGLFANLTRFVYFRAPSRAERDLDGAVAEIEGDALDFLRAGTRLGAIYDALVRSYARVGHGGSERLHHQGGTCGYLSRDAIALPGSNVAVQPDGAAAFNPSLPGAKIEDTVLVRAEGVEVLTTDARWPARRVHGRKRPDLLHR